MLISVITPSYNSADTIERAIQSVVDQDYPQWEHIIVDGGSTDGTLDILKKHPHLHWISEPDKGQADAMNKGFARSKGDVIVYLNADDYFFPGAFSAVVPEFKKGAFFVVGNIFVKSKRLGVEYLNIPRITLEGMLRHWEPNAFSYNPVGYFYRREVQNACPFNAPNYSTMDLEFLLDAAALYPFTKVEYTLGCYEDGLKTKTHQTQIQHDYWQPATFPYLDRHIARLTDEERENYLAARRAGYVRQQAESNWRRSQEGITLSLPPSTKTRISVIIPAYNCREYISRAVDSVLRQDVPCLEILVVDDASPDDVVDVITKRYGGDERVILLRHAENKKQGTARNTGLKHASGDYVFFLDADDWLDPGGLKALLTIAEQYEADIVACGARKVLTNGKTEPYHAFAFACKGGREALWYLTEYYIGTIVWNKLYRKKFLIDNELFFLEKYYYEDVIFSMRAVALCNKYISINDVYMNYFQSEDSTTSMLPTPIHLASLLRLWPDIDSFADSFGLKNDQEGSLLLKKLLYAFGSCEIVPRMRNYMRLIPRNDHEKYIDYACADVFGRYSEMAADIIKSMFLEKENIQYTDSKIRRLINFSEKHLRGTILYKPCRMFYNFSKYIYRKLRKFFCGIVYKTGG